MKSIGIMGPGGKPMEQDENFNLAMSEEVTDALSEKCERVKQLEKDAEDIRAQWKSEVEELKDMVQKIAEDNLRLKKLLEDNGVDWHE